MGVCGLIRFYCESGDRFWLEDIKPEDVKRTRRRLRAQGARVTHIVLL